MASSLSSGFIANAFSLGAATGQATNVTTTTFTQSTPGVLSAASAFALAAGHSSPGAPPPTAAVVVHASATGGGINVGSGMQQGAQTDTFAFHAASADTSSFSFFDQFSSVNAIFPH